MPQGTIRQDAESLLIAISQSAREAAIACRTWERGGDPDAVGETAADALDIAERVFAAMQVEDDLAICNAPPETRRGRLALAGWLLLLAGTDEHGESTDLKLAAAVFRRAADA